MKNILLLSMLLLCPILSAQNVKIEGTVVDSIRNPMEMANVIATRQIDGGMENYAITSHDGKFSISLTGGESYILTASFLGMKPASVEVDLTSGKVAVPVEIILFPDEDQLEGVELVYEMPVTVRGDTLIYNTDSFTNGTERKLGDVLKKLPGIQVTEDGEIEVEGKRVSKVMVDGKDFFDGDSKLATKNIPADALSKVEVLKNYNEVDQMRGLGNDQDNIAINIQLKDGKKNFWFGELEGGLGDGEETRYNGKAILFFYSPKTSVNLIGDANNVGDVPFTFMDYFKFTGGFRNFNSGGGTNFNINDSGLGFLMMQNDRANEIETGFGAANFTHKISEKWDISGFAILSDNRTDFVQHSLRNYIQTNATELSTSDSDQHNQLGMAKISSVFKPNALFQMDYDLLLKKSVQTENAYGVSTFSDGNEQVINPVEEIKRNEPFSVNQNLNAYYTLNVQNIFAGYFQHLYQDEDPFYNAVLQLQPFANILPLREGQDLFNINQEKNIKTQKLDAKIDYYRVINDLSNINITLGATLSHQEFDTAIFQMLDSGAANYLDEAAFSNEISYDFRDVFLGVHYKFKKGIYTFTPGLALHNYTMATDQSVGENRQNFNLILPDLYAIAQLRQSESVRFNYRMTADFTDVKNLAEGYVFNNYNRLFRGNRTLENGIFHSLGLDYFNFSMFNFTNINGGLSYSKRVNAIRNTTYIEQINQVSSPINSNFPDETFSANGSYGKTFRKFKTQVQGNISLSKFNLLVNEEWQKSRNYSQNYQGSIETNFKKGPNFEIGYNLIVSQYNNGGVQNTFFTNRPFANVEFNFLKDFTFTADYNYYNYSNKDESVKNQYSFLDASLYYQKRDSSWEFKMDATNLFNVATINRDSFNEHYNMTTEYFVQPRILMFSLIYNL